MSSERIRQIEEIFDQVAQLPQSRRAIEVERLCEGDGSLRDEVLSLLACEQPPDGFLSQPALSPVFSMLTDMAELDDLPGSEIGPYRVDRRLDSGGMGTVYFATRVDGQFDQDVAIKVVKRGMDSEEILRRFREERRTLGALNHPNIARLLEGGVLPDGRPYLVMDHVAGMPIDEYADGNRLSTSQRLRLFCRICEAVSFAHRNLVIHRDLKPQNILVTQEGEPKLLDFGIAKVISGTGSGEVTALHLRRFTPEYASPEHIGGLPLTTATDVYSLGVVLYELLTGHRPYRFETRTTAEIERIVRETVPLAPSSAVKRVETRTKTRDGIDANVTPESVSSVRDATPDRLHGRLRGDLDAIILKAMHKDPARRYPSVEQFATDIERHLSGMPVLARPDTTSYRLRKLVRRHAAGTAVAATIMLALLFSVGSVTWSASQVRRDRDAAFLARDQAEQTVEFFEWMLAKADPFSDGPDTKIGTILKAADELIDGEMSDQPLVQASIHSAIGRTCIGLGLLDEAERHIASAYETRVQLLDPGHHDLAESQIDWADLHYHQGRFAEAEKLLRKSLATHERIRGKESADTARVLNDLGAVLRAQDKLDEAQTALEAALEIRRILGGQKSGHAAESLNNLASVLLAKNDFEGAEAAMQQVLNIRKERLRPEHPLILQALANLAVVAGTRGDYEQCETIYREVVEMDRKVFGDVHPALATDLASLGGLLSAIHRKSEAEPFLREALDIRLKVLDRDHPSVISLEARLGRCLYQLGNLSEAEPLLANAVKHGALLVPLRDRSWPTVADYLEALYLKTERPEKAAEVRTIRAAVEAGK